MGVTVQTAAKAEAAPVRDGGAAAPRRIARRRALPGGRALAGGFLIAVAVVGVFSAYSRATAVPSQTFVVAARTLPAGTELAARDVRTVGIAVAQGDDLDERGLFTDPSVLMGARTLGPIGAGEFIQASSVLRRTSPAGTSEISIAIEPDRAVGGHLRPGERVHVLGTFGGAGDAYTAVVVPTAYVVAVDGVDGTLGSSRVLTITLAVASGDEALAVAHAVDAGKVTLVRAGAADPAGPYRPPAEH